MMWLSKQVTAKRTIPYLPNTPTLLSPGRTNGPLLIKWPDVAPPFPIPYHLKQESRQPASLAAIATFKTPLFGSYDGMFGLRLSDETRGAVVYKK